MQRTLLSMLILLSACAQQQPMSEPQNSISGQFVLWPDDPERPNYGVHRSPSFDYHVTATEAHKQLAKKNYHEAFGGFLAACDEDHPDNCFRAAYIFDRKLMDEGSLSIHQPRMAKELFEIACNGGIAPACARASSIELP